MESSMDTLRLAERARKITNVIRRNVERQNLTSRTLATLSAENERLKAKVRELSREIQKNTEISDEQEALVNNEELSDLQLKLQEAEKAAQNARECSKSVVEAADRWRMHRHKHSKTPERGMKFSNLGLGGRTKRVGGSNVQEASTKERTQKTSHKARDALTNGEVKSGGGIEARCDPIFRAKLESVLASMSSGIESGTSPPISAASSCGRSEELIACTNAQCSGASFEQELRNEIQRRKSISSSARNPVTGNGSGSWIEASSSSSCLFAAPTCGPQSSARTISGGDVEISGHGEIESDAVVDSATKRKLICNAVELVLLRRRAFNGEHTSTALRKKLDEATLSLKLHEARARGRDDQMVLVEGLLKNQRETVERLSKENESLRRQLLDGRHIDPGSKKQVERLRLELSESTDRIEEERKTEDKLSQGKDRQIILLKGLLKNQCATVEKLSNENVSLKAHQIQVGSGPPLQELEQVKDLLCKSAKNAEELVEERIVTVELEKLLESFRERASLQDEKIDQLTQQVHDYSNEIEEKDMELNEMKLLLSGERMLRQQVQAVQAALGEYFGTIATEHTSLRLRYGEQLENLQALQRHLPERVHWKNLLTRESICEARSKHENEADHDQIELGASNVLLWAGNTIEVGHSSPVSDSNDAKSKVPPKMSPQVPVTEFTSQASNAHIVISNIEEVQRGSIEASEQPKAFDGNLASVDFYLPKLCVADSAGPDGCFDVDEDGESFALGNILRQWQVEFLNSLGLNSVDQFVRYHDEGGNDLARSLRVWRNKRKLPPMKTQSCAIALHIWSRSCKAASQSVKSQRLQGLDNPRCPESLEISSIAKSCASTIGFGSAEVKTHERGSLGEPESCPTTQADEN